MGRCTVDRRLVWAEPKAALVPAAALLEQFAAVVALTHAIRQCALLGELVPLSLITRLVHVEQDHDVSDELDCPVNEPRRPVGVDTTVRSCPPDLRDLALVKFRRLLGHEDALVTPDVAT